MSKAKDEYLEAISENTSLTDFQRFIKCDAYIKELERKIELLHKFSQELNTSLILSQKKCYRLELKLKEIEGHSEKI